MAFNTFFVLELFMLFLYILSLPQDGKALKFRMFI